MPESRFTPLLIALVLSFVPFAALGFEVVDVLFKILLILGATYAIARDRRHIAMLIAVVSPVIALQLAPEVFTGRLFQVLAPASGIAFLLYITVLSFRGILRTQSVTRDVLMGGIAVFLLLGYIWSIVYMLVEVLAPGSFAMPKGDLHHPISTLRYFSFVTLTSLGYGDIVPVGIAARQLAVLEACAGQIYLTVFIGRLLGFSVTTPQRTTKPVPGQP